MIIRGGYSVYPREVEEVLYEHPAVAEAAVVARARCDPRRGSWCRDHAQKAGRHTGYPDEIGEFVRDRIAAYKYPRIVWFIEEDCRRVRLARSFKPGDHAAGVGDVGA